jgi:hypothetical protein
MNTIKRRIERLEQSDNDTLGIGERLQAALNQLKEDPEGSNERVRQMISQTEAAVRDGHYVSAVELRITASLRRILCEKGPIA